MRGRITLRNESDGPQKNIALQISSSLHWVSIKLDGKPVEFLSQAYTSDIDHTGALTEAIVTVAPVSPEKTIDLEIGYEGTITQDASRLIRIGVPAETAKHSDWDQIGHTFSTVRGIGYVAWYPVATEAASLSDGDSVLATVGRWKQRESQAEMKVNLCLSQNSAEGNSSPPLQMFMNDAQSGVRGGSAGVHRRARDERPGRLPLRRLDQVRPARQRIVQHLHRLWRRRRRRAEQRGGANQRQADDRGRGKLPGHR